MDALRALYHPNASFQDVPLGIDSTGFTGIAEFLGAFFVPAAGEHRFIPKAYLGTKTEGVVEWVWEGTMNELDLFHLGQATPGRKFAVQGNSVFRFDTAGLVTEERDYWDVDTVRRQLRAES